MMLTKSHRGDLYGWIGFILLGIFGMLYSIFWREFAQVHIQLPFLSFPIFIGEILLFFCLLLAFAKVSLCRPVFPKFYYVIFGIYLGWLLIKAFFGYKAHGPLAFRTAALFYYPLFFVIGYIFYNRNVFSQKILYALATLFLYLQASVVISAYFRLEYLILSVGVAMHIQNKKIRYAYLFILAFLFPYSELFSSSKSHLLGLTVALLFLLFTLSCFFLTIRKRYRIWIFVVAFFILIICIFSFGRTEKITAMLDIKLGKILEDYRQMEVYIQQEKETFQFQEIPAQIYSEEVFTFSDRISNYKTAMRKIEKKVKFVGLSEETLNSGTVLIRRKLSEDFQASLSNIGLDYKTDGAQLFKQHENMVEEIFGSAKKEIKQLIEETRSAALEKGDFSKPEYQALQGKVQGIVEKTVQKAIVGADTLLPEVQEKSLSPVPTPPVLKEERMQSTLEVIHGPDLQGLVVFENPEMNVKREYSNIFFRINIWRDMVEDLIEQKAWLGINFGKPQRSKRIEILGTARKEWMRDGWITPHNSFFHIIYRAGILGVVFLVTLVIAVIRMIKSFIIRKSFIGIMLSSVVIYWLTIANFLVFLEFPYTAIPFWSSLGIIFAYLHQLENKKIYEDPH